MREKRLEIAGKLTVGVLAEGLLVIFAAGVLAFLVWHADAPDVIASSLMLLPWIVGPAALAALLVVRAWSTLEAWLFVGAEVAAIALTVGLWMMLFAKPEPQNAQYGIAILIFPLFQFAALLAFFLAVSTIAPLVRRRCGTSA